MPSPAAIGRAVASTSPVTMSARWMRDLAVVVSPAFGDIDVLGMNFLSRLKSWRVEGQTLILTPHHPQGTDGAVKTATGTAR